MYLSIHVTLGALIGRHVKNPILAFLLGFAGHFFTDMVPHGDSAVYKRFRSGVDKKRSASIALIDSAFAIIIAALLLSLGDFSSSSSAAAAIIGSVLPDLIIGMHIVWEPKWLDTFHNFHFFMHDFLVKRLKDWKQLHGAIFQSIVWVLIMVGVHWR